MRIGLSISIVFLSLPLFFTGCQTGPRLSPMQIRQLTTRTVEGNYKNVFKATLTILQDQQYIIKNTDMDSGLIVASVERSADVLTTFFTGRKGSSIEVSCMVNNINDTSQELRINIQEVKMTAGVYGSTNRKVKPVYDEKIHQNLFNQILVEVKRREAMGR